MRLTFLLFACCSIYLGSQSTHAAFILDDFDDSAEVVSPAMEGDLIQTGNVGDLGATRNLLIFGNGADPEARLDSNLTLPSHLTGEFIALNPNPGRAGLGRFGFSYAIDDSFKDFTENGQNDAIFIDIASIVGETPPPSMMILVQNTVPVNGHLFLLTFYSGLPTLTPPSTVILPFDQFTARDGTSAVFDFTSVSKIFFDVFSNGGFTSGIEDQPWTISIDRIRVGTIPEPSSLLLCAFCLGIWAESRMLINSTRA